MIFVTTCFFIKEAHFWYKKSCSLLIDWLTFLTHTHTHTHTHTDTHTHTTFYHSCEANIVNMGIGVRNAWNLYPFDP